MKKIIKKSLTFAIFCLSIFFLSSCTQGAESGIKKANMDKYILIGGKEEATEGSYGYEFFKTTIANDPNNYYLVGHAYKDGESTEIFKSGAFSLEDPKVLLLNIEDKEIQTSIYEGNERLSYFAYQLLDDSYFNKTSTAWNFLDEQENFDEDNSIVLFASFASNGDSIRIHEIKNGSLVDLEDNKDLSGIIIEIKKAI